MAEKQQEKHGAIDLSNLVVTGGEADDAKIAIVENGVVTLKAVSGDATISEAGSLQLGAGVVGTTELGGSAVTTAKINDGAVTAGKIASSAVTLAKLKSYEGYDNDEETKDIQPFVTQAEVEGVPPGLYVVTATLETDSGVPGNEPIMWVQRVAGAGLFNGRNQTVGGKVAVLSSSQVQTTVSLRVTSTCDITLVSTQGPSGAMQAIDRELSIVGVSS